MFDCGFLITLRAGEFGLIAGLFFKDRRNKGRNGFQLMAVRPRQQLFDIVLKACRRFARSHDNHELKGSSLTCLDTPIYNKCPDIRGGLGFGRRHPKLFRHDFS